MPKFTLFCTEAEREMRVREELLCVENLRGSANDELMF